MSSLDETLSPFPEHDEGLDYLAAYRARHADDGGLLYCGVLFERAFDLARVDLEAADEDYLSRAPDEVEIAVLVEAAYVAGAEPAVRVEAPFGELGAAVVARRDARRRVSRAVPRCRRA